MVASIGAVASASQGVSYYERDGYYAKDDPEHRAGSAWAGRGAEALGLSGQVDPGVFKAVLEGRVPDGRGRRLGRRVKDGAIAHRPGRDLTLSAPKSVSLAALVGGDERMVAAHDKAVKRTLEWVEEHVAETRLRDPKTGRMVRAGGQEMVAATFRHDTSRNLDPQLHTHAVIANMLLGEDDKWRTMANEKLYASKMLIGALYRSELAKGLKEIGYGIEKTHADGRFEIAGVSREVIEAFSTRRTEIQAAMNERGLGKPGANPRLAERAALMTRSYKREMDREALREIWQRQAADLGFDAQELRTEAAQREPTREHSQEPGTAPDEIREPEKTPAERAVAWAVEHLAEREAVFSRNDLLAAALASEPGAVAIEDVLHAVDDLEKSGKLHAANLPVPGESFTTDKAIADEKETIALMHEGQGRGAIPMRGRAVDKALRNGPLTVGQKAAVKMILSDEDRVVGVQGYAGTGKTRMLNRTRALLEKRGFRVKGLAPSASAAQTLAAESGIESETLQRFLARNAGVAAGRLTEKGQREMRAAFKKTVLVVDEGSLASTVQTRNLLRIARELRLPRVVLVGDGKQLDAVDAGKPFVQLQQSGMKTATMDEIMRQREPELKAAVEASLGGDIKKAFEKLGANVAEVEPDNLAGAAAARWLRLPSEQRENTGLIAPSHKLRHKINDIVRERLIREGQVTGPALETTRLMSRGYTRAQKTLADNYTARSVVGFHRSYKRLGVEKGDELKVHNIDRSAGTVNLIGNDGELVNWDPRKLAARTGGVEVYRADLFELRQGDRIRWTKNDAAYGLVNSQTAEVTGVKDGAVSFKLEDGRTLDLKKGDPQLSHIDRSWASTAHAFQGRTVDTVIAAMEANHPHLTTQKTLYVEISRARDRAELVTDNRDALRERLESVTGERISALEAVAPVQDKPVEPALETVHDQGWEEIGPEAWEQSHEREKVHEPHDVEMEM